MFWLRWLGTAESSSDPHAAINSHNLLSPRLGTASEIKDGVAAVPVADVVAAAPLTAGNGCRSGSRISGASLLLAIITPHTATNRRNPTDHARVCVRRLKFGSDRKSTRL